MQLETSLKTIEYMANIAHAKEKTVILNPAPTQPLSKRVILFSLHATGFGAVRSHQNRALLILVMSRTTCRNRVFTVSYP